MQSYLKQSALLLHSSFDILLYQWPSKIVVGSGRVTAQWHGERGLDRHRVQALVHWVHRGVAPVRSCVYLSVMV